MRPELRAGVTVLLWAITTALRSMFTHPYQLAWWFGILVAFISAFVSGWYFHTAHTRGWGPPRHRKH